MPLFCIPYAGGSAAVYRSWAEAMPRWLELQPLHLPGRGRRIGVPPVARWSSLIDLLVDDVAPMVKEPFGIFGHSMGALIGFELAHALRERLGVEPRWLGVSACVAPARRAYDDTWLTASRERVIEQLRSFGGTPDVVLKEPELLDLLLPALRADFHLCGTYRRRDREPLEAKVLVLGGSADELSNPRENLMAWARETSGPFELKIFDGDHFFVEASRGDVVGAVAASFADAVAACSAMCRES
ncbi:MAG TPA: alpha/beta fold hydrolase [Polyangiaceae bacterium]|nr:alpha/beta fold hydrolase [Polyangiaceae bacterium]